MYNSDHKPLDKEKEEEIRYLTLNHIIIEENDNDEFIIKKNVEETLLAFKSENKSTVDKIKEVNLGTVENLFSNLY